MGPTFFSLSLFLQSHPILPTIKVPNILGHITFGGWGLYSIINELALTQVFKAKHKRKNNKLRLSISYEPAIFVINIVQASISACGVGIFHILTRQLDLFL